MTLRQKKVAEAIRKSKSLVMQEVMINAGYSESYAKASTQLKETKGFRELVDEILPDSKLLKAHDEALVANKVISAQVFPDGKDGKPINDFIDVPDHPTRLKAVELGYKLKRKIGDSENPGGVHFHAHIEQQKAKYGI